MFIVVVHVTHINTVEQDPDTSLATKETCRNILPQRRFSSGINYVVKLTKMPRHVNEYTRN